MLNVNVDPYAAEGAGRRFAGDNGLTLRADVPEGNPPHTDGKVIHVRKLVPGATKNEVEDWWAELIHETRHCTPRGKLAFEWSKETGISPMGSFEGYMVNLFEDSAVDHIDNGTYIGMDEAVSRAAARRYHELFSSENGQICLKSPSDKQQEMTIVSFLLDVYTRQAYLPDVAGIAAKHLEDAAPSIKKYFEKAVTNHSKSLMHLQKNVEDSSTAEVWEWVKNYLKDVFDYDPDTNGASSKGAAVPESGAGEGEPKDGEEAEGTAIAPSVKALFEEFMDPHDYDYKKKASFSDMAMSYDDAHRSLAYTPPATANFLVVDYQKQSAYTLDGGGRPVGYFTFSTSAASATYHKRKKHYDNYETKDSISTEAKRHIQTLTRCRVERNLKKGKLDHGKLYKLGLKGAPPNVTNRVFWKKEHKLSVKETAISLGIDYSGSMSGRKIIVALHAVDLLADMLRTIGVAHEIWGFTTLGKDVTHLLLKPFSERVQRSKLCDRLLLASEYMSNNNDGDNILYAYHRLIKQQANRRIMIVLSDGQPAGPYGDIRYWTKQVIDGIVRAGMVELHGIGILDRSVEEYYPSSTVLSELSSLESGLLGVLKNRLATHMVS